MWDRMEIWYADSIHTGVYQTWMWRVRRGLAVFLTHIGQKISHWTWHAEKVSKNTL
jgi:hypothetical protein